MTFSFCRNVLPPPPCTCQLVHDPLIRTEATLISESAFESLNEVGKNDVHAQIYGTGNLVDETDAFVNDQCQQLEWALQHHFSAAQKENYLLALEQEQRYPQQPHDTTNRMEAITSVEFRLMFLRAEQYHASKAASRMVRFFNLKRELFGVGKLCHQIGQDDLTDDDREVLQSGAIYINDDTLDHQGRCTMFLTVEHLRFAHIINLQRATFYYLMTCIRNHGISQRRGVVKIQYSVGYQFLVTKLKLTMYDFVRKILPIVETSLPFYTASMHQCYNNLSQGWLVSMILLALPKEKRARFVPHCGTHQQVHQKLLLYGIASHLLPIDQNGTYHHQMLHRDLEKRYQREQTHFTQQKSTKRRKTNTTPADDNHRDPNSNSQHYNDWKEELMNSSSSSDLNSCYSSSSSDRS